MSMWTYIKKGFGYGFGGRIGWEAGGMVWGWIRKLVGLAAIAVGVPMAASSLGAYQEVKQRYEKPAKPAQVQAQRQRDQVKEKVK